MTTPAQAAPPAAPRARGFSFLDAASPGAPATPAPGAVGEVLGDRFELLQRIGRGGMAVVYLAHDRQLPQPAAIKILCERDPAAEQRFLDELDILGTLPHPHLVHPLGCGRTASGHLYMAMELVRGDNLRDRLLEFGPLLWREALDVGIQVAEVLAHLHAAGVLHRDVKPGNIMLLSGSPVVVKLIDLGVAKKQPERWPTHDPSRRPRFQTEAGTAVGTPHYQPLEAGLAPPDPRLDVYGLAATIHELCTGKVPERAIQPSLPEDCPPGLKAVLARALAVDPDARTPTIEALLIELRRLRDESQPSKLFDGRYVLLRRLGSGGKAEVWLAHHRKARRDVALKLLTRKTDEELARLAREAQVLSALHHPAFPQLFDAHDRGEQPYLALELVHGERASKYIDHPLQPAHVLEIGAQLARALIALHELGVLHRDIHSGNVLVDFEGGPVNRPIVKLIDLGMCEFLPAWHARVHRYDTPPDRRTELGGGGLEQLGWTAPEARRGLGWTEKSDVWSVGLLLFQLLTGRRPFAPGSDQPISPRTWAPTCSSDLAHALLAALHPDPDKRLDAAQLLARLLDAAEVQAAEDAPEEHADDGHEERTTHLPHPMVPPQEKPAPPPVRASRKIARHALTLLTVLVIAWLIRQATQPSSTPNETTPLITAPSTPVLPVPRTPHEPTPPAEPSEPAPAANPPSTAPAAAPTPEPPPAPPRPIPRKPTFEAAMARIEPQARTCARTAGLAEDPRTVQVRRDAPGERLQLRVIGLSAQHPFTRCLTDVLERSTPPLDGRTTNHYTLFTRRGSR